MDIAVENTTTNADVGTATFINAPELWRNKRQDQCADIQQWKSDLPRWYSRHLDRQHRNQPIYSRTAIDGDTGKRAECQARPLITILETSHLSGWFTPSLLFCSKPLIYLTLVS